MNIINPLKKVGINMEQRRALGKGLSSLIPSGTRFDNPSKKFLEIPLADVITNPQQPRKLFSKESIDELAASIEEKGVLQPIMVRPLGGGKYELIAGERRFRAARQIGLEIIPAVIKEVGEDETLELALIENIQREDLNVIEEALAYKDLLSKFQYTQDELAKHLGKDRSSIANSLRLLKLPEKIRTSLINNELSMGHARALLALDDKDLQMQIAQDIVANSLSVRDIENLIKKFKTAALAEPEAANEGNSKASEKAAYSEILMSLETRLKDRLRLFVKIKGGTEKGKITISYENAAELNDISQRLLT